MEMREQIFSFLFCTRSEREIRSGGTCNSIKQMDQTEGVQNSFERMAKHGRTIIGKLVGHVKFDENYLLGVTAQC